MNQSEISAAMSEMNKKMEKNNQRIAALGEKRESIDKVLESRAAMKKKYSNEQKELETENDLLQVKTLRELCSKSGIPMQEIFSSAFAILMEKVSNKPKEENLEVQQKKQTVEINAEDFDMEKSSAPSENIEQKKEERQQVNSSDDENSDQSAVQKKDKGKPLTPLEKAKLEQQKRIAQKQPESPPKQQQPVQKN
ncbi:MAG: hypothetical protein IKW79_03820, partial [Schwartzia sp.]|nr:hypothetical protein [Schwartzia sp. (in: firmicutes)]